jgi:hypothetical protein
MVLIVAGGQFVRYNLRTNESKSITFCIKPINLYKAINLATGRNFEVIYDKFKAEQIYTQYLKRGWRRR